MKLQRVTGLAMVATMAITKTVATVARNDNIDGDYGGDGNKNWIERALSFNVEEKRESK